MFTPEAVAGYLVTAIFTIVNLLVTYFVLKRFLFKPILKILRKRRTDVENELNQAEEKLTDADTRLAKAHERLENSSHEASAIVAAARSQAEAQAGNIMTEAKQEATALVSRADVEVARMRIAMLNEVRDEIADLSVTIASKVIGQVMDEKRQRELVDRFLDEQMQDSNLSSQPSEVKNNV
jgi:F-type H+-transporting ATPase subunit b